MSALPIQNPIDKREEGEQIVPIEAEAEAAVVDPNDEVPDGGYGWACVAALSVLNAFVWGVAASYGVYLAYYLASDTFHNATPLDYAMIGGLNFAIAVGLAPLITVICRRLGTRLTMIVGVTVHAAGFVSASFAESVLALYLTQGVLIGIGIAFIFIPSVAVLPQWFQKRRTLAQGLSSAGSGVGGIAVSLGTNAMIKQYVQNQFGAQNGAGHALLTVSAVST